MSNSSMMEFMSQQFPAVYKNSEGGPSKVICTPEVSLYQYNSSDLAANGMTRLEDKVHIELGLPSTGIRSTEVGSEDSATGSTSSTSGFQCGFCGKTFQQKNTFQNHLRSHREENDAYECDICHKTFAVPARLTRHYRTHTGEKPYQCEYCSKSFSVKENLSVHRRIHTKERPYRCQICERAFEHSGKLHRHMRIHTGERPHRCNICQKTFIQSGQLVIHMRTHTGEKPYVCKVCNKGFTCSKQLKVHTRTHTGEKPYSCEICGKSFGYNHVLKLHQVAHYGEKVYKCTLCSTTFSSKKALESHIKTHSEGSVPNDNSSSPKIIDAGVPSPPALSQTPPNSDKENRESSDSEISSQNSPHHADSPKTPPSPISYSSKDSSSHQSASFKSNSSSSPSSNFHHEAGNNTNGYMANSYVKNSNNNSPKNPTSNLPYPMLPPGVQVHQSPQSRTTFLYVTSKLPVSPSTNSGTISRSESPPTRHFSQISSSPKQNPQFNNSSLGSPNNFKAFGGLLSNGKGNSNNEAPVQRDKLFLANASIRDKKVLPFLEQFGYGLPKESNGQQNLSFGRKSEFENRRSIIPENFSLISGNYNSRSNARRSPSLEITTSYSTSIDRDRSPEIIEYNTGVSNYTPGGVLALALTRGSKAVMQSSQFNNNFKFQQQMTTPPRSNSESSEYGLDFSARRSVSPTRNSLASLTPTSTPRSTPGLSESADDLMDDQNQRLEEEMNNNDIKLSSYGGKRRASLSGGSGPRKRSSLILEKYAQESTTPNDSNADSAESILSQRLRLSSVIQYAEKCS